MINNSKDTWTLNALQNGDIQAIQQRVLDEPAYLVRPDGWGDTPLLTAIHVGHLSLVEFLLQHGADPNVASTGGYTGLLTAIESEQAASTLIVAALIKARADLQQTSVNGWAPLHMAAAYGHVVAPLFFGMTNPCQVLHFSLAKVQEMGCDLRLPR